MPHKCTRCESAIQDATDLYNAWFNCARWNLFRQHEIQLSNGRRSRRERLNRTSCHTHVQGVSKLYKRRQVYTTWASIVLGGTCFDNMIFNCRMEDDSRESDWREWHATQRYRIWVSCLRCDMFIQCELQLYKVEHVSTTWSSIVECKTIEKGAIE